MTPMHKSVALALGRAIEEIRKDSPCAYTYFQRIRTLAALLQDLCRSSLEHRPEEPKPPSNGTAERYMAYAKDWISRTTCKNEIRDRWSFERQVRTHLADPLTPDQLEELQKLVRQRTASCAGCGD